MEHSLEIEIKHSQNCVNTRILESHTQNILDAEEQCYNVSFTKKPWLFNFPISSHKNCANICTFFHIFLTVPFHLKECFLFSVVLKKKIIFCCVNYSRNVYNKYLEMQ